MELTSEQKQAVSEWIAQGLSLSDIQKLLKERFQLSPTFMEVRFMVLDLDLKLKEQEHSFAAKAAVDLKNAPQDAPDAFEPVEDDALAGGVTVEIDRIKKPGAMISGSVRFSDGVKANWMLDQFGRVALDASQPGYRPSQEDLMAFQQEIGRKLQQQGY